MAKAILYGVAQKMIENLGSQIFQEIGLLWGVRDELEKLKNTISTIQAVLQDAAEQQSQNHQVRDWLEKLNDAVFDAGCCFCFGVLKSIKIGGFSEIIALKAK
nr:putative disease resistance protein rga4 [Quercus suber]